jgi:hypothetical protein
MGVAPELGQSGLDLDDIGHMNFVCHHCPAINALATKRIP